MVNTLLQLQMLSGQKENLMDERQSGDDQSRRPADNRNNSTLVWFALIIVVALAIRRLPYALRACTAALHQVSISLEEASENLGAGKTTTVRKIVVPLMAGGIVAGFVTSFATAAVELSATLMLVTTESDAPLAYGIYVFMQSAAGRGPGAALGLIAVVVVAFGSYLAHHFIERNKRMQATSTGY